MRRDEAERSRRRGVAAAGDDDASGPLEHGLAALPVGEGLPRMGRVAVAVGGERAPITGRDGLGGAKSRSGRAVTQRSEERPVRRLRARPHHARERVQEDDRAAVDERRPVAPQAEHEPQAESCSGDRIERLSRHLEAFPRERDDERVERLGAGNTADCRAADERLRMRHRRRSGEGGDHVEPPPAACEQPPSECRRQDIDESAQGGVRDAAKRVRLPRIAPVQPGLPGVVEHEGESDHRCRLAKPSLELGCEAPPARARDLEQRLRPTQADHTGRACVEQCARAAVERRLGGADRDDEVGVDERRVVRSTRPPTVDGAEVVRLAVVDDDPAAEVTCAIGARAVPRGHGGPAAGRDRR